MSESIEPSQATMDAVERKPLSLLQIPHGKWKLKLAIGAVPFNIGSVFCQELKIEKPF